jgi:hypothetical protein
MLRWPTCHSPVFRIAPSDEGRTKNQILLVKVNKQMLIHPVRHLTVVLTNRPPVSHASHDSQTMCLDDVVDVAEQEHQCCICTAWILTSTTKISKLCLQGTISVTSQVVYPVGREYQSIFKIHCRHNSNTTKHSAVINCYTVKN